MGIGILLSLLMIRLKVVIKLEWSFILILITSLIVSTINPKWTCLSYVLAIIYGIDWCLVQIGIKQEFWNLSYTQMMYLVGILHLIEGILTFFFGGSKSIPVMTYRGRKVAGGYEAYGKWLIPLFFFSINGFYLPIIAAVVYCNDSFVLPPEEKAKIMGSLIGSFGIGVMFLTQLVVKGILPLGIGIFMMPILHEVLFWIDTYIEKGELKYDLPDAGIRVMEILGKHTVDINRGDIIKRLNGEVIWDEETYIKKLESLEKISVEIENLEGHTIYIVCTVKQLKAAQLVFLPPY